MDKLMLTNHIRKKTSIYQPTMKHWLGMCIKDCEGFVCDKKGKSITHGEYVNFFVNRLKIFIQKNDYQLIDEKQFKNEISTFIYTLSDNT
jgi:hypothetical protein